MAVLNLTQFWITLLSTGEQVHANHKPLPSRQVAKTGEVREYVGGRRRAVSTVGTTDKIVVTLLKLTLEQVQTLESWTGQFVLARDWRGQGLYGTFFVVATSARRHPDQYESTIEFTSVTLSEGT
ncbi:MAG: hypothetical protein ABW195_17760 [Ilumatobacteraceae bacterium]